MEPQTNQNNNLREAIAHNYLAKHPKVKVVLVFLLVSVAILIVVMARVFYIAQKQMVTKVPDKDNVAEKNLKQPCKISTPYKNQTSINLEKQLIINDPDESDRLDTLLRMNFSKILGNRASGKEFHFYNWSVNEDGSKVAFTAEDQSDQQFPIYYVYVYSFPDKDLSLIWEHKSEMVDASISKTSSVGGLLFVNGDKDLLIGTSSGIKKFNFDKNSLETLFEDTTPKSAVYMYGPIALSENGEWLVVGTGYYEGAGHALYNLKTKVLKPTDLFYYTSGKRIMGWYKNDLVVGVSMHDPTALKDGFYLVDPVTLAFDTPINDNEPLEGGFYSNQLLGNLILFQQNFEVATGKYTCNNMNDMYPVTADFSEYHILDVNSKSDTKIMVLDVTNFINVENPPYRFSGMHALEVSGRKGFVISLINHVAKYEPILSKEEYRHVFYDVEARELFDLVLK